MAQKFWQFVLIFVIIIHSVNSLEGIQVIVINSTYNNSTVNTTNNFDSMIHNFANYGTQSAAPPQLQSNLINSSIIPSGNIKEQYGKEFSKIPFDPNLEQNSFYFGAGFSPYVKNDMMRMNGYTNEDIEKMLKVILTMCHSVLTFEMGYYANPFFYGPYDATSTAKIASLAAKINLERNATVVSVSQGSYILDTSFATQRFPDLDAAFYSAQKANGIYPGTVSGITVFVQDPSGSGFIGLTQNTAYYAALLLRQYSSQAHSQKIKMGVIVSFCDQIFDPNDRNFGKELLLGLISVTDYIMCEIYPSSTIYGTEEYHFENVKNSFKLIKAAFSKVAPSLEIILFTGLQSNQNSFRNTFQRLPNDPLMIKRFWDAMKKWSIENQQKVNMYQAFDTFEKAEVGYENRELLNGYWRRVEDGVYLVKGTQEIVVV